MCMAFKATPTGSLRTKTKQRQIPMNRPLPSAHVPVAALAHTRIPSHPCKRCAAKGEEDLKALQATEVSTKCLMVGRPCGQFQGCWRPERFRRIFSISPSRKAFPIMMAPRQARQANNCHTFVGLGTAVELQRA